MKDLDVAAARHEVLVIRAKNYAASLVNPDRPLAGLRRSELREIANILIDAALTVSALEDKAPGSRSLAHLALAAEDGDLTAEGQAIVDKRAAERERRRLRRAVSHA